MLLLCVAPARAAAQAAGDDMAIGDGTTGDAAAHDTRSRRGIRGAPLADSAAEPHKRLLHEWEVATFPQAASPAAPASTELVRPRYPARGRADLPAQLLAGHPTSAGTRAATVAAPSTTAAWIDQLATGDLPVRWDARVIRYLEFYRDDPRGRAIMGAWLRDQGRFRELIVAALRRHRLPQDLLYLCMIESSYDPWEYSRSGASGLWQFMPATGRIYGLRIDHWVDERNDPVKSTEAALFHLKDLYNRFGDWHLAMAAYNAGHGAVLGAIAKYNTNDFWSLLELESGLPWESSIYVPKALAAAIVGKNRAAFGYAGLAEADPWRHDAVSVPAGVSFQTIARAAGASDNEIVRLNPGLRRRRTPPGGAAYEVRIPVGRREAFARAFPQLAPETDGFATWVLRHGERFEDVARVHGISSRRLEELNGVDDVSEVRGGTVLVVPRVDDATRAKNRTLADDELYCSGIAPGAPGDPMIVAVPDKDFAVPDRRRVFYRVVAGDSTAEVAGALGLPVEDLLAWNRLDAQAKLQARMVLVGFVPEDHDAARANLALLDEARLVIVSSGTAEHLDLIEGRKGRQRVIVKARRGDTLESIGRPHHLGKYDMARINRRSPSDTLVPGEEVLLYTIVDRAKAKQAGVLDKNDKNDKKKGKKGKKSSRAAKVR